MSLKECIFNAGPEREGILTAEQAKTANDIFDELEKEYTYGSRMSVAAAKAKAGRDTFDILQFQAMKRKQQKLLQIATQKRITIDTNGYRDMFGNENPGKAALALIEQDSMSRYSSVVQRQDAVKQLALAKMSDVLASFRKTLIGETRNKALLSNVVKELFGEETGDTSAKELALAWKEAAEYLRKRFNAAGGSIPSRLDWGLPQSHDMLAVRKATMDEWKEFIRPRLDRSKMIDSTTNQPITEGALEIALTDIYNKVSTDGFANIKPGTMNKSRALANTRLDKRFLVFKGGEAWYEYQKKFGGGDPFDIMIGHIEGMSRDIGLMEILGPNPNATIKFLQDSMIKRAAAMPGEKELNRATAAAQGLESVYLAVTARNNMPVNGFWANTMAGTRQIINAAFLGSTSVAALSDLNFQRFTKKIVGLPQTNTMQKYLELLNPLSVEEKGKLAVRLGLIAESWTTIGSTMMRYTGDIAGPEISRRFADFVMRGSGLSPWTQAGRWSFGMEFLGALSDMAGKSFDELDPVFRKTMEQYGLTADRWEIVRKTPLYEYEGASFLRPDDIEARTDIRPDLARDLATRLLEMVNTETNYAVPTSTVRGRSALLDSTRPGTVSGELMRSFAMYKNFGVTLLNTHIARGVAASSNTNRGRYFADFIITTTLVGGFILQLKEMSKGRDPRPMTDPEFWQAAFLQGGGFGIYGDFLFSNLNRYGSGLETTIAGPVVGMASDIKNLTFGNLAELLAGEDTKIASEAIGFAGKYTPGVSLWYSRLATERLIFDQLRAWADPEYYKKTRQIEGRYAREYGQKYWWKPGEVQPRRAPDLSNVIEERR